MAASPQPTERPAQVRHVETEAARPTEIGAPPAPPAPPARPVEPAERRFARLPLLILIAVLAAAASGLATYLATRGSGASRPPTISPASVPASVPATPPATADAGATATTPTKATTPASATAPAKSKTGAAAFTGPAATLVAKFRDPAIANTCAKSPHPGGQATLNCSSTAPGGKPVELHVDLFGSSKIVLKNYSNDALGPYKAGGGTLGSGTCTGTAWSGEGPWARGRRACFVVKGAAEGCKGLGAAECSIVYWYDAPSRVAVRATVAGARAQSAPQLAAWWDAHKADFGG